MRLALLLMAGIAAAGPVSSQQVTAPPPACKSPENRTLDFWVGDWDALDDKGNLIGTNRITRDEYGDCVITEHFDGTPLIGHSVSIYRPGLKQWRQTWVDNQGSYLDFIGEWYEDEQRMILERDDYQGGKYIKQRMVFSDIQPDSLEWSWERSEDGGMTWVVQWQIHYERAK